MKYIKYLFYLIQLLCVLFILTKILQFAWWIIHPVKQTINILNTTQNYDKIEQHVINFIPFGEIKTESEIVNFSLANNINVYGIYANDKLNSLALANINSKHYILQVGDQIQNYTLTAIGSNYIELCDDSNQCSNIKIATNKTANNSTNNNSYINSNNLSGEINHFMKDSWNDNPNNKVNNADNIDTTTVLVRKRQ